jgi:excisionase family DNA binding protein
VGRTDELDVIPRSLPGNGKLLLTAEETADTLGISRARIFQLLASGHIKSIKIGRSRRIPVAELERWVSEEVVKQSA